MGKKPKSFLDVYKSIRRSWNGVNPVTRVKESDKVYSRAKANEEMKTDFFEYYYGKDGWDYEEGYEEEVSDEELD